MDLLLYRYKDMEFIMGLDGMDAVEILNTAIEKREEDKAWQMWLMRYQRMTEKNFMPFSEFYSKARQSNTQQISQRPTADILAQAERIQDMIRSKKG